MVDSFNSLYGIHLTVAYNYIAGVLSIPFMGYSRIRELEDMVEMIRSFQFPLWDTTKIIRHTFQKMLHFQFPLWDTSFNIVLKPLRCQYSFNSLYGIQQ